MWDIGSIGVVWLWYVWLPLAYHFAKKGFVVVWYDIGEKRITDLKQGIDITWEIWDSIKDVHITYVSDVNLLRQVDVIIVTVPTPINEHNIPDFTPLESSSAAIWTVLQKWQIVVYESTVYPGCTEELCLPILERGSGLSCPSDFQIWYSPERINPGDAQYKLDTIMKVVAGIDFSTTEKLADLYGAVVSAGIYKATSIRVAEAAKIIENTQRDINIGLMNELQELFDRCNISIWEVLDAARTKWNFLPFSPGLVWWHCIGVDPYRLAYKAQEVGMHPDMILAGRRRNDYQPVYVANKVIKYMLTHSLLPGKSHILILWLTFKPDVPDFRNSKVVDLIEELRSFGITVFVNDPYLKKLKWVVKNEFSVDEDHIVYDVEFSKYDLVFKTVAHKEYDHLMFSEAKHFLDLKTM